MAGGTGPWSESADRVLSPSSPGNNGVALGICLYLGLSFLIFTRKDVDWIISVCPLDSSSYLRWVFYTSITGKNVNWNLILKALNSCPEGHPAADKSCYLWLHNLGTILMCMCVCFLPA